MKHLVFGSFAVSVGFVALACGSSNATTTSTASSSGAGAATTTSSHSSSSSTTSSGSTSSSSGAGGAGGSSGTGGFEVGPVVLGTAITNTTQGEWNWVPFSEAFCADGSPTGIGVNPSPVADSPLLIYMEGGGACWSGLTCWVVQSASFIKGGYDEASFQSESTDPSYLALQGGFFDRTSTANPFQNYNYVYIPYCTGDIHAGTQTTNYGFQSQGEPANGTKHVGFLNVQQYLARLVPTFSTSPKVYLAGSSAGGFGAALNWWNVQRYFGSTEVDLIDDSGTPMPLSIEMDGMGEATVRNAWRPALPPGCTACETALDQILPYYNQTYPTHRAALLSFVQDKVLPGFFQITESQFETGLNDEITSYIQPSQNFKYFTNPSYDHVLWFSPQLSNVTLEGDGGTYTPGPGDGGTTVQQFLTNMVSGDAGTWESVGSP